MFFSRAPQLDQASAKAALDSDSSILLVDVREVPEFESGHIKGALNIPLQELAATADKRLPDKDQKIFLYCRSGARSNTATKLLVKAGYTNVFNIGGVMTWPYGLV